MQSLILIVDDEEDIRFSLQGILEDEGYQVATCSSGEDALSFLEHDEPEMVFLDIWLPGIDGLEVLEKISMLSPEVPVVMISGHGNIETAVESIKKGAFDFIEKPLSLEKVVVTAKKALEFSQLQRENLELRSRVRADYVSDLTGKSKIIQELRNQIDRVAPTDAWVLITGDNGTGKEIVARSIHRKSRRAKRPLIAVNCAAIPEELIESELFGHEKGAFTGAERAHKGKFEAAHRGTLFLDEIGDMSLKTQAKILRILQEQTFERVGGQKSISVDVRVIVATNKDLETEIKAGRFREDLYYRLKVFPLHLPRLKERPEDIPLLLEEFLQTFSQEHGYRGAVFTQEAIQTLQRYSWPGNVRELKNFTERMLIMYAGQEIGPHQLPPEIKNSGQNSVDQDEESSFVGKLSSYNFKDARLWFEKSYLQLKYEQFEGNIAKMAEAIGLERSYLYRKLKGFGLHTS